MSGRAARADRSLTGSEATVGDLRPLGGRWTRELVKCPSCGLVLTTRAPTLTPHHCPRCLTRRGLAVELEPHGLLDRASWRHRWATAKGR